MIALREATDNADTWMFDSALPLPPGMANRTVLQGQIVWSGLQDGYAAAGASDSASPYATLYWNLGDAKQHCLDCPDLAMGSPYDPPWAGAGSNQLTQSPGDGQTECGAACKCSLSYEYPSGVALDQLNQAIADRWQQFMATDAPLPDITTGAAPAKGAVLTPLQRGFMDEFRNAQDAWNEARGSLPAAPGMFNGSDWTGAKLTPWGVMTPYQQSILTRLEQVQIDWLHAVGQLNWPVPPYEPDLETKTMQWLKAASKGDFTAWWKDYRDAPDPEAEMMAWLEQVAQANMWPDPPPATDEHALEKWLEQVGKTMQWPPTVDYGMSYREAIDSIKLYNPNHDSKGRFTYGANAKTTVARGQGKTRRGEGGKRVSNGPKIVNYGNARSDMTRVFGGRVTNSQLTTMMQAGRGDTIHVEGGYDENSVEVRLEGPRSEYGDIAALEFSRGEGGSVIGTGSIGIDAGSRGVASGRQVLTGLQTMSDMGVTRFDMIAVAGYGMNGYDTWAKLGATGTIPSSILGAARAAFGNVSNVEDIMSMRGGPQWWRVNGDSWQASFDLRPGSRTMNIVGRLLRK